jgi:NAD(P)-dependent dehydrogenase (short-subunit alcohol dehydrogenase family)
MPKSPNYFRGKTIVITGAASGIGRATALDEHKWGPTSSVRPRRRPETALLSLSPMVMARTRPLAVRLNVGGPSTKVQLAGNQERRQRR